MLRLRSSNCPKVAAQKLAKLGRARGMFVNLEKYVGTFGQRGCRKRAYFRLAELLLDGCWATLGPAKLAGGDFQDARGTNLIISALVGRHLKGRRHLNPSHDCKHTAVQEFQTQAISA